MAVNDFDKAARYAVRADPEAFLGWVLNLPGTAFGFRRWADTRGVVFPGGDDRTGDTVAEITRTDTGGEPWLFVIEFQLEPDPEMFGRMLEYLGNLWRRVRPDGARGSRFAPVGVVVNLTGTGNATRCFDWPAASVNTTLLVNERNLATESADELLGKIGTGAVSRAVLPLMTGADEPGTVERWKVLAEAEPDDRRRSNLGGLAKVFADAAGRYDLWSHALEGWNMKRSRAVLEWLEEGRQEGQAIGQRLGQLKLIEAFITTKFGQLPDGVLERLRQLPDDRLEAMPKQLVTANNLSDLGLS